MAASPFGHCSFAGWSVAKAEADAFRLKDAKCAAEFIGPALQQGQLLARFDDEASDELIHPHAKAPEHVGRHAVAREFLDEASDVRTVLKRGLLARLKLGSIRSLVQTIFEAGLLMQNADSHNGFEEFCEILARFFHQDSANRSSRRLLLGSGYFCFFNDRKSLGSERFVCLCFLRYNPHNFG